VIEDEPIEETDTAAPGLSVEPRDLDDTSADPNDPDEPRRRTAPEPGSAAERAAARRARMREQRGDEKGPS
jgi:hypothetical protein